MGKFGKTMKKIGQNFGSNVASQWQEAHAKYGPNWKEYMNNAWEANKGQLDVLKKQFNENSFVKDMGTKGSEFGSDVVNTFKKQAETLGVTDTFTSMFPNMKPSEFTSMSKGNAMSMINQNSGLSASAFTPESLPMYSQNMLMQPSIDPTSLISSEVSKYSVPGYNISSFESVSPSKMASGYETSGTVGTSALDKYMNVRSVDDIMASNFSSMPVPITATDNYGNQGSQVVNIDLDVDKPSLPNTEWMNTVQNVGAYNANTDALNSLSDITGTTIKAEPETTVDDILTDVKDYANPKNIGGSFKSKSSWGHDESGSILQNAWNYILERFKTGYGNISKYNLSDMVYKRLFDEIDGDGMEEPVREASNSFESLKVDLGKDRMNYVKWMDGRKIGEATIVGKISEFNEKDPNPFAGDLSLKEMYNTKEVFDDKPGYDVTSFNYGAENIYRDNYGDILEHNDESYTEMFNDFGNMGSELDPMFKKLFDKF